MPDSGTGRPDRDTEDQISGWSERPPLRADTLEATGPTTGKSLKVLVLTSRTGGGHDARAEAFGEWVEKLHGNSVEVVINHTLEDSSPWYAFGVELYNKIQRNLPVFHHFYYHLGELFGLFQSDHPSLGLKYFDRLIKEFRPDIIFSVHSILNKGYFRHAKQVLGSDVYCVTYCGEFKGSYGFSRNWVAQEVDLFLGRTTHTLASAQKLGLPADKAKCLGHLLNPAYHEPPMTVETRADFLRKELDLDPDRFTLLLATGGAGAHNHVALLDGLLPFAEKLQAIVLCGRSAEARERLAAWQAAHPELRIAALPYTKQMHRLLQVASAVVARPGTTTSAEALQLGCPIIFNRIGGTMPQEYCTLRYFRTKRLSPEIRSPRELAKRLAPWLDEPSSYMRYLAQFRAARTSDDPETLVATILGKGDPNRVTQASSQDQAEQLPLS